VSELRYYILEYTYKVYGGGACEGMIRREVHTGEKSLKRSLCDLETSMRCSNPIVIAVETYTKWKPKLDVSFDKDSSP